jgi:hypothetical protein
MKLAESYINEAVGEWHITLLETDVVACEAKWAQWEGAYST